MKTVSFGGDGQRPLALDVFEPTGPSERTAVLVFHGGGLRFGSRAAVHSRAERLAALGFTAFAAEYRLLDEAPWPAQIDDACAAVSFVQDQAKEFDVEPDRVVVQGHSAGGHLALLAGTRCRVAAVVAYYPTIGFHAPTTPSEAAPPSDSGRPTIPQAADGTVPGDRLLGEHPSEEELRAASPIQQVNADSPPTLILHGGADWLIKPFSSVLLYQRLAELGVDCDLHIYAGQSHEFDLAPSMLDVTARETALFIRRNVSAVEASLEEALSFNPTFAKRD